MAKCKYEKREHQVSEDNGMTWVTDEVIKGDLIEYGSADCPDSGSEVTKWVTLENDFICEDKNKYKKQVLYVSYDEGVTWYIYFPTVYQKGEFVGVDESFCANKFEGHYEIGEKIDPVKIIKCDGNTTLTSNDINYYYSRIGSYYVNLIDAKIGDCVTSIGDRVFQNWYSLTSCTIGSGVTYIGTMAFRACSGLTSVTIGSSVTTIGAKAFEDCKGLESIYISDSVTTIGDLAFEDCYSLTSCTIGSGLTSIGSYAFKGTKIKELSINCQTAWGFGDSISSVTLGNNVITIAGGAFAHCTSLSSITIPDSVTTIGTEAFDGCSSLTSIDIPNSVTTIGDEVFYYCTSLTSCTIGSGITYIGTMAFNYCDSLTSVTCLAATPPALGNQTFGFYGRYNYPIYVPAESVDLYKASWPIRYADRIQAIP